MLASLMPAVYGNVGIALQQHNLPGAHARRSLLLAKAGVLLLVTQICRLRRCTRRDVTADIAVGGHISTSAGLLLIHVAEDD